MELEAFARFDGGSYSPVLTIDEDGNTSWPDGVVAGAGLAARLGLEVGDWVLVPGGTVNHFREVRIAALYNTNTIAADELLLPMDIARKLAGIGDPQELGTDGLWAKLKEQVVRVVLLTVDSVSGLIYPSVVTKGEE